MKYLVLIADIDEFNPCKNSLGDLVKKEYSVSSVSDFRFKLKEDIKEMFKKVKEDNNINVKTKNLF